MPKQLPANLLAQVQALLRDHPDGLTLADLEHALGEVASRRSLQRRLRDWESGQVIRAEGVRRGRRYFAALSEPAARTLAPHTSALDIPAQPSQVGISVPISAVGREIQVFVHGPMADRPPVGYRRAFMESYVPNESESAYLSEVIKTHLHEVGRTPDKERPAGTFAREILGRLLIDLSWSSSRLEGNTYSLLDTRELIERDTEATGKDAKETQMILNHKAAIELLVESAEDVGVNRFTITNLHALLADNLLEDARNAGRLRTTPIAIGGSTYIPTAIPQLIEGMFSAVVEMASTIQDPFEQSFFLMVHIPYLQPFVDASKRTSRLASNISLIRRNLAPLSFIDVPEQLYVDGLIGVYELNRVELLRDLYVWAYERSARQYKTVRDSLPEPDPFRLRYRTALTSVVGDIVRRRVPLTEAAVTKLARPIVKQGDVPAFTRLVLQEIDGLHDGNISRFRLRLSEFLAWRTRFSGRKIS